MSQAVISTSQPRDSPIVERNIHEMLKDTPVMNDSNNAVHSGTAPPTPQRVGYMSHPTSLPLATTTGGFSAHHQELKNCIHSIGYYQASLLPTARVGESEFRLTHTSAPSTVPSTPVSPTQNGDPTVVKSQQSKIETIKNWSISTYKCTKQLMFEKLGKTSRTVDTELEAHIEQLRDTQRKYSNVLRLSRALASHFFHVVQTQHALGEAFSDLAQKSPELQEEFLYNAETQRNLTKNGETLLGALNFFVSSVNTLCNKTIEDTLLTIRQYETARIEYDAYRTDLELLAQAPRTDANTARLEEAQQNYELHKVNFEKLRSDVSIKLKFLDENRIKVMHKQLLLFHNAVSAYFSGNQAALEATLKQFNIKVKSPNSSFPSWLEQ